MKKYKGTPSAAREFASPGGIAIGANYWASHAGVFMWRDWRPEIVAADLAQLAQNGLTTLRVFPLWPDFQPVHSLRKWHATHVEYRAGEKPLERVDGLDETMLDRFGHLADLASEHGIDLVVGLITGWMSGRLFVPPALERLNPITDPEAVRWQLRFIRGFVDRHRAHPAIVAWDLGNECNCMGAATREQAWLWTATLSNAIRAADPDRVVISGMHSLKADPDAPWSIRSQGELTDILTTHPYALFTPHCAREPIDTMRPLLHAAAETCLYADLSGKPAIIEEFGTLGPTVCGAEAAARMARVRVFDTWTHDARVALWWCAYDQSHLEQAPYEWLAVERELGLFRADRSPKPEGEALSGARAEIAALGLPGDRLPARRIDAVCILTAGQDQWGAAFTAFILAKQAGFDLRFHYGDQPLPEASLYLLPSVKGRAGLNRTRERELWARVEAGATLYVSLDDGGLGEFHRHSGLVLEGRAPRVGAATFGFAGHDFSVRPPVRHTFTLGEGIEVLAAEADGTPVFTRARHGRGVVYSLLFPLETALANEAEAFMPGRMQPFWMLYAAFARSVLDARIVGKTSPWVGITEHRADDGEVVVVATNYAPHEVVERLRLNDGYGGVSDWTEVVVFGACSSRAWRLRPARTGVVGAETCTCATTVP